MWQRTRATPGPPSPSATSRVAEAGTKVRLPQNRQTTRAFSFLCFRAMRISRPELELRGERSYNRGYGLSREYRRNSGRPAYYKFFSISVLLLSSKNYVSKTRGKARLSAARSRKDGTGG